MTALALTLRGRARAEALMTDSGRLRRPTGTTTNPDGSTSTDYEPVDIYAGKARIQTNDPYEATPDAGEHQFVESRDILQLPMTATGVKPGDVWEMTASALDPDLVGRVWSIAGASRKTHQTMRRFYMTEVIR